MWQTVGNNLLCQILMFGFCAFNYRKCLTQNGSVAEKNAVCVKFDSLKRTAFPYEVRVYRFGRINAFIDVQSGIGRLLVYHFSKKLQHNNLAQIRNAIILKIEIRNQVHAGRFADFKTAKFAVEFQCARAVDGGGF